ncbi:MAG: sel1 repeat family protein, partial [Alphaproteobacteria bacterium]|nr:sel1 repeat family protein [Alphaproteobacteria bacterium]
NCIDQSYIFASNIESQDTPSRKVNQPVVTNATKQEERVNPNDYHYHRGMNYFCGDEGLPKDFKKAVKHFEIAAEQYQNPAAQF